jgi:hypothetical protein
MNKEIVVKCAKCHVWAWEELWKEAEGGKHTCPACEEDLDISTCTHSAPDDVR